MADYIIPAEERGAYRATIQRANRRIKSNINYIKQEGIREHSIKTSLAGDYYNKKKWATKASPLSTSTRFKSREEYEKYMRHVNKWGEDTGRRGGYQADPRERLKRGKEAIYKAVFGLTSSRGISLEEWGGNLPPDMVKNIEDLSLEQMNKFFDYVNDAGDEELFDSDQVNDNSISNFLDYVGGRLSEVVKFFPRPTKKKKKSKRKKKGRKKR